MFEYYKVRHYNFKLLILVLISIAIGTVVIYSADNTYLKKQLIGAIICVIGMVVLSLIDYHFIAKFVVILYIFDFFMLFGLRFFGKTVNGATRWYALGSAMTIQPSEFTKIIMIICAAVFLVKQKDHINKFVSLFLYAIMCAVPLYLIVTQTNLSTTIDLTCILFAMLFVAGLSYKLIIILILFLIPVAGSFIWYIQTPNQKLLQNYQLERVLAFIYPQDYLLSTGYQQYNSVMAIGSGMLTGKGLNSSTLATVKDANLISEQQTDFIFSVVGEELGFVGSVIIIAIIALIVLQCTKVARKAKDDEGMLIATGVAALIAFQTFINIGVATALLPNTGLPLPFISYGLSSLISSCAGIGLVLNIGLQRRKF